MKPLEIEFNKRTVVIIDCILTRKTNLLLQRTYLSLRKSLNEKIASNELKGTIMFAFFPLRNFK